MPDTRQRQSKGLFLIHHLVILSCVSLQSVFVVLLWLRFWPVYNSLQSLCAFPSVAVCFPSPTLSFPVLGQTAVGVGRSKRVEGQVGKGGCLAALAALNSSSSASRLGGREGGVPTLIGLCVTRAALAPRGAVLISEVQSPSVSCHTHIFQSFRVFSRPASAIWEK